MRTTPSALLVLVAMLAGCFGDDGGVDPGDEETGDPDDPSDETEPGADDGEDDPLPEENGTTAPENETPEPRDPVTWTIIIQDNRFVDGSITIQQGDTVSWQHEGNAPHTVTSEKGGELKSGTMTHFTNNPWPYTFETVDEFPYFCEFHTSMTGTITVLEVYLKEP